MTINFNVDPYFDDYNEDDKYLRVLFRPGYPVQARELTQAQSILQNQVARFGNHVFKQGSMVTPGQISYDGEFHYLKLQNIYNNIEVTSYVDQFVGQEIVGSTSGIRALVIFATEATSDNPPTLYVKYLNSGTDTVSTVFADNEEIVSQDSTNERLAFAYTQDATGTGSGATIERGVYFINGYFVQVDRQTIILDNYSAAPSYRVGLAISEDIVTPEEDNNLFDNAQGSTNYAAPGAHRFKIALTLEKRGLDSEEDVNFVELLRIKNGEIQYKVKNAEYADIMETMARRTYDESGDYTVRPFGIDIREHRNNNRGLWAPNTSYLTGDIVENSSGKTYVARTSGISTTNQPTQSIGVWNDGTSITWEYVATPAYNRGIYTPEEGGDEAQLAMGIEAGKAYVRGFEIEKLATTYVPVPKSRSYAQVLDGKISTPVGNFIQLTNIYGIPSLDTLPVVDLRDAKTVTSGVAAGNKIGTARIRGIELETGLTGSVAAVYKASLFDIQMHTGITYAEVTNGGSTYSTTVTSITGANTCNTAAAHNMSAGDKFVAKVGSSGTSTNGLTTDVTYYVISAGLTSTAFRLSLTDGGAAITLTNGTGLSIPGNIYPVVTVADPFTNTAWTSGGTVSVGSYVSYVSSGVKNHYLVVAGTTLGSSGPSFTYGDDTNGSCTLRYVGTTAKATSLSSGGVLTAVQITNPGHGYITGPNFTFSFGAAVVSSTVGLLDFSRLVKQVYYFSADKFVADISPVRNPGIGTIYCQGAGYSALVTGNGTQFRSQVKVGDILRTFEGVELKVGYVISDDTLYATTNVVTGFNERAFTITNAPIFEPNNLPLLYKMPYNSIRRIRSVDDSTIGTTTRVRQYFPEQQVNSSFQLSYTTETSDETFMTPDTPSTTDRNYLLVKTSGGGSADIGTVMAPVSIEFTDTTQRNIIVTVPASFYSTSGARVRLIATINKSQTAAREKIKTLNFDGTATFLTQTTAQMSTLTLGKADCYRVQRILQSNVSWGAAFDESAVTDITDQYTFNDGQRETHYDLGSVTRKSGVLAPTGPVRVYFEYFSHTGTGDYFSVDSYSGITYKDIPLFKGQRLSEVIDFRPRINDDGKTFSDAPNIPKRTEDMLADYTYYLARRGSLYINKTGTITNKEGVPSLGPELPETPGDSMVLYNVTYMPYTYDITNKQVIISNIDNRRYTMRDIGKLESRIDKLEEFTKLSLLERATASTQIMDPATAADRLKAGFIVDTFDGHSVGDVTAIDYRVSIDTINREMRPLYNIENVNLIEAASTPQQRVAKNYIVNGDVVSLPYTHQILVNQPYASRTENINPFAIFTFIGNVDLNPASDEWIDIENVDVTVFDEKEKDSLTSLANNSINPITGKKGMLGNYYGAWEAVATGVSKWVDSGKGQYTVSDFTRVHASVGGPNSGYYQKRHDEVVANQIQQQRVQYSTEVKLLGNSTPVLTEDKVTSSSVIPYIRSRPLLFVGKGIKPNTTVNPYFDGTLVASYVTPAVKMDISNRTGTFDGNSNVGSASQETARQGSVDGKTALAYNRGDVVYVASRGGVSYTVDTSPATAIVCLVESNTTVLRLINVKGSFVASDVILGTVSGARASVSIVTTPTTLVTNDNGEVAGVFTIPNTDKLRFRCGSRTFRLSDQATDLNSKTRAEATYLASGVKEKHNRTFSSVRHYEIATRELGTEGGTKTWVNDPSQTRTVADTNWYDPLAQTFLVQNPGGAMITKIDVFFQSKDANIPVTMELRETVNGYPGKVILPFSKVTLNPADVKISDNATLATTFTFPTPIALRDKAEYALVLLSDSNNYRVWISQMGEKEINSGRFISEQPYMGVLFKSQNGSTWTAEQMQDMKFTIHRAKFDTSVVAEVDLINDILPNQDLHDNPFETTTSSGLIVVTHYQHGMTTGSKVRLTVESGTYHGISSTILNNAHTITRIDHNRYSITVAANANATGLTGGSNVVASRNIQFNQFHPSIEEFLLPDTYIEYSVQAAAGKSQNGTEVPYQFDEGFVGITPNQSNFFRNPRMVGSSLNELTQMNGAKSVTLRAKMYTTNDALTPMLDLHRTSALMIENIINQEDANSVIYVDEVEPHAGSASSKYMTKKVKLATPATGLYVAFDANVPPESNLNVYYKIGKNSDAILFELLPWKIMVPDSGEIPKTDDGAEFKEMIFSEETLEEYDVVQVKVVLSSTNSSAVPRVQSLKVIALS